MQERARCEPMSLAEQGCCEILLCPQCNAVHLHIGPVSFKLSTEAFRCYQPEPRRSESGRSLTEPSKH